MKCVIRNENGEGHVWADGVYTCCACSDCECDQHRTTHSNAMIREATDEEVRSFAKAAEADGIHLLIPPPPSGQTTTFYVAFADWTPKPVPVAIGGIMPYKGGARIRGAWVNPAFRRHGIWWRLVEHRLAVAREWGVPYVETWAVHPGPLLRNAWRVASTRHRDGAVHVRLDLQQQTIGGWQQQTIGEWVESLPRLKPVMRVDEYCERCGAYTGLGSLIRPSATDTNVCEECGDEQEVEARNGWTWRPLRERRKREQ